MVKPPDPISVLILAGGRSRRLGQDKVWLDLNGQPLVERVARSILPVAAEIIFSSSEPDRFASLCKALIVPAHVVSDEYPGAGPLAGIQAGLRAARHDLVLVLAADMPFLSLPLIGYMRSLAPGFDAVVPLLPGPRPGELQREPLHAFYRRTCLPAVSRRLAGGERQAFCFLPDVQTRDVLPTEIARFDPAHRSFFNINTAEDWRRGLELAESTPKTS